MNALAKIDGVMPWVSASAQADLEYARWELVEMRTIVRSLASLRDGLDNGNSAAEQAAAWLAAGAVALLTATGEIA